MLVSDAGSGLRELGAALVEEGCTEADLFLSHMHVDHVLGLPFFPFAFQSGNTLRLWSVHQPAVGTTEGAIRHLSPPLFPVPPEIFTTDIADFRAGRCEPGIAIRTAPLRHPGGDRLEYEGSCYVTDTEHEPRRDGNVVGLIEGAEIFVSSSGLKRRTSRSSRIQEVLALLVAGIASFAVAARRLVLERAHRARGRIAVSPDVADDREQGPGPEAVRRHSTAPLRHPGGRPAIGSNTRGRASATSRTPSTSRAGGMGTWSASSRGPTS